MSRYRETDRLPDGLCAGCRFWKHEDINEEVYEEDEFSMRLKAARSVIQIGECHKRAPRSMMRAHFKNNMAREEREAVSSHAKWPEVWCDDWCGEFEKGLSPYAVPKSEGE